MNKSPRPRRTRRISRQQILETAITIVDQEGLAACNMRRIAQSLGVEAMALYNHVANKDALLDGMAEMVLASIPIAPEPAERWQEELSALAEAYRQALYAHPALLPIMATRPLTMTVIPAILPRLQATLARSGLDYQAQCHAENVLAGMILGLALQYIGAPHMPLPSEESPPFTPTSPPTAYVYKVPPPEQAEADLAFGLALFIQGIEERTENVDGRRPISH